MDEKLIVSPRADGKSMLQLTKALGTICSVAWGISEAEGFKMVLEAMKSKENKEDVTAHGNWIRLYPNDEDSAVSCSVCKTRFDYIDGIAYLCYPDELPKYCPECGARMDKAEKVSGTFSF